MEAEDVFQYKPYLFTIAYNLTGNSQLAEDLVQDTFEKWLSIDKSGVKSAKAYLSKIIVNKSIDSIEKQKKERELYKGLWLPEPFIQETPSEKSEDLLDYAFLFLLEKLNPYERAVFVLRSVFDYSYEEISEFTDLTTDNCRQILHRAKEKVKAPVKSGTYEDGKQKELLQAFMLALYLNDFDRLEQLLKEDIVFYSDGGGKASAALKPLHGIDKVKKFLVGVTLLNQREGNYSLKEVYINGGPAVVLYKDGKFDSFFHIEVEGDRIGNIFSIRNPDKIRGL